MSLFAERLEEDVFEVVCYMISSAANLPREAKAYGPFRLIDTASRLIAALEHSGIQSDRLESIRGEIEQGKYVVMTDEEEFDQTLQRLALHLVPLMDEQPLVEESQGER